MTAVIIIIIILGILFALFSSQDETNRKITQLKYQANLDWLKSARNPEEAKKRFSVLDKSFEPVYIEKVESFFKPKLEKYVYLGKLKRAKACIKELLFYLKDTERGKFWERKLFIIEIQDQLGIDEEQAERLYIENIQNSTTKERS